jgi:hypothetical protein
LSLADKVREWVVSTNGTFRTTDVYHELGVLDIKEKSAVRVVLSRLVKQGIIEQVGKTRGEFRLVDQSYTPIDWRHANASEIIPIKYPFELEQFVNTMPGNIIVVAGEPNSGKTAFLLNIVAMNMGTFDIHYFNSEMGDTELRSRMEKFSLPMSEWRFSAWERNDNFADVIKPDSLNIIDYLEIYDEFYLMGKRLKEIHDKLNKGIAVIAIQKNKGQSVGRGGITSLEKPRLYLGMEPGVLKIVKAKNRSSEYNPDNTEIAYKLVAGCKFIPDHIVGWHETEQPKPSTYRR